jgi:hypothetical protein
MHRESNGRAIRLSNRLIKPNKPKRETVAIPRHSRLIKKGRYSKKVNMRNFTKVVLSCMSDAILAGELERITYS